MAPSLYDVHDDFSYYFTHIVRWMYDGNSDLELIWGAGEVRNSTQRFRSQERTIQGICSKGLLRKSTYSCGNNVIVKFNNPNYNTFVVKIAAVNDTDTFVKPRECKIGDIQHTSQLIPRNRDEKVDHFSRFKVLTLTFHPMKRCSLFYNTNSQ